ncbi:MAG: hypothetical protein KA169_10940 [Burkholderiaceae bacterium]|nr:hypothetical protein [Burkholderiaceae bacterium]
MTRTLKAGTAYFLVVFTFAFAMGVLRVLVLVPRMGEVAAVLIEVPLVVAVSWWVCRWATARWQVGNANRDRLMMGAVAFGLLIAIEWAMSVTAFGRTSAQFVQSMFTPAGVIGLAGQVVFGLMPLLLRTRQAGRG